ncbi:MAG TPA: hypothetical protein VGI12_16860 [Vicinamibacterales bacterium]|jgi:uncharacterized membrane protein
MLARVLEITPTVAGMCGAGLVVLVIGLLAAKHEVARASGLDSIVALANVCVAVPLAVFGALHLFGVRFVLPLVPRYMPGRLFWAYLVGVALMAASLSIATRVAVRWSGLLFGLTMFLFVAMIHFPGALRTPHDRIIWMIVFREMSFGGAGWLLAGCAMAARREPGWRGLIAVGRVCAIAALLVFGVEHFLHPLGMPGVPLAKEMPSWVPARPLIDYVTGAALLAAAASVLTTRTRTVAAAAGGWLLLLLLVIYVPVMIAALSNPGVGVQLEGVNYFADTLLFTGVLLALARAAGGILDRPTSG